MSTRFSKLPVALRSMFNSYRRRLKIVRVAGGAFLTLGILVLTITLAVAGERLLRFETSALRVAMLSIVATGLFTLTRWVAWPLLSRMSARRAAAWLGRACPDAEEDLVSAVELTDAESMEGVSAVLVDSALEKIAVRSVGVNARHAVSLRPVFESVAFFLVVASMLASAWAINPQGIGNALRRLFVDSQEKHWTATSLDNVLPVDNDVWPAGSMVRFQTDFVGETPDRCLVRVQDPKKGAATQFALPVNTEGSGAAGNGPTPFYTDVRWRMEADAGRTEWRTLRFFPVPAITAHAALVTPPAYVGESAAEERFDGTLEILEGSSIALILTPSDRGTEEKLAFIESKSYVREVLGPDEVTGETLYGEKIALRVDGNTLRTESFTPLEGEGKPRTHDYIVTLEDGYGLRSEATTLTVRVMPDRLPVVKVVSPRYDVRLLTHETLYVGILATDDHRVRKLVLWYQINRAGQKDELGRDLFERRIRIELPDTRTDTNTNERYANHPLSVPGLDMEPGDMLRYGVYAYDNKDEGDETRFSSSPTRLSRIVSNKDHFDNVIGEGIKAARNLLTSVAKDEGAAAAHVDKLSTLAADATDNEDAQTKIAADARKAERKELRRTNQVEQIADELRRLVSEAERNPTTPMDTIAQLRNLEKALRETAEDAMEKASDALAKAGEPGNPSATGATPPPSQQLEKLKEAGEETTQAEEDLRTIVDRLSRLHSENILARLADEAQRLATRQSDVHNSMVPIARAGLGLPLNQLPPGARLTVQLAARSQTSIAEDVAKLTEDIMNAIAPLSFNSAQDDAEKAKAAYDKLFNEQMPQKTKQLADDVTANKLLDCLPAQAHASEVLAEVAQLLRDPEEDPADKYAKKLQQFIRRQGNINTTIELAIKRSSIDGAAEIAGLQSELRRDVAEAASAIRWLARQDAGFDDATAQFVEAAAGEMHSGALALYRTGKEGNHLPKGLRHGKQALALLTQAAEALKEETQQGEQGEPQEPDAVLEEIKALLHRLIREQDNLNTNVGEADMTRRLSQDRFFNRTLSLAERQSSLGAMALHLADRILTEIGNENAAAAVTDAAAYLETVRRALDSGDTTKATRVTGQQAIALLELLIDTPKPTDSKGNTQGNCSLGGEGGYEGGSIDPHLRPDTTAHANDQDWLGSRSRFEDSIAGSTDVTAPPEYRALVEAYFRRLRAIPQTEE